MDKKLVKLVVYPSGTNAWAVPPGCPKEFSCQNLTSRMAFAEWLLKNGEQYYLGEKEGVVFYTYKDFFTYDVAVVEIDISRPWMFSRSNYDGSEHILCDRKSTRLNSSHD